VAGARRHDLDGQQRTQRRGLVVELLSYDDEEIRLEDGVVGQSDVELVHRQVEDGDFDRPGIAITNRMLASIRRRCSRP